MHVSCMQAQTFEHILNGKDLIGRARTGMGKTLAFALPVIEKLRKVDGAQRPGRYPRVLVMAPTRELAKQVRHRACGGVPMGRRPASMLWLRIRRELMFIKMSRY